MFIIHIKLHIIYISITTLTYNKIYVLIITERKKTKRMSKNNNKQENTQKPIIHRPKTYTDISYKTKKYNQTYSIETYNK